MSSAFGWLSLVAPPLILGVGLLRALGVRFRDDRLAYLGWLYVAGVTAFSTLMLAFLLIGAPLHRGALGATALVLGFAAALAARWFDGAPVASQAERPLRGAGGTRLTRIALHAAWITALVVTFVRIDAAAAVPIHAGDEAQIWAARAKVLFTVGALDERYAAALRSVPPFVFHADYPWANPLLQVWVFLGADQITHFANRLPSQLAMAALVLVLAAGAGRMRAYVTGAAVLLAVVATTPAADLTRHAFADGAIALAVLVVTDAWLRERDGDRRATWLLALGLAFAVCHKNEGLLVVALVVTVRAAMALVRTRRDGASALVPSAAWLLPVVAAALQRVAAARFELRNDVFAEGDGIAARLVDGLERAPTVLHYLATNVLAEPSAQRWLVAALAVCVVVMPRHLAGLRILAPATLPLGLMAGYALVFVATPRPLAWHLDTAAVRISFHAVPAAALLLCAVVVGRRDSTRDEVAQDDARR